MSPVGGFVAKKDALSSIRKVAQDSASKAGCELVDVKFEKEGIYWYLRVFIDKEGGVNLDDCEAVSHPINAMLDAEEPIEQSFFLEVSSPGLERHFSSSRDYEKAVGKKVETAFYKPIDGIKHIEGTLVEFDEVAITLKLAEGLTKEILIKDIAKINRKHDL